MGPCVVTGGTEWSREADAGFVGRNNTKVVLADVISIGAR